MSGFGKRTERPIVVLTLWLFVICAVAGYAQPGQTLLLPSDGAENDQAGRDVAVFGDFCVVGANYEDNEKGVDAGAAYVFRRDGDTWIQEAKLVASDGAANDMFGYSVDISDSTILVGSCWDDDAGAESGSAYIFERQDGAWVQSAKLTAGDAAADDRFGIEVETSDGYALVGAFFDDDKGNRSGSAYIFKRTAPGVWVQQTKLIAADGAPEDWFGTDLSLHGADAAVGVRLRDEGTENAGAVYVYHRSGETWTLQAKLTADDTTSGREFGVPCIFGNTLVVGAPYDDENGTDAGAVYVFERSRNVWTQKAKYTAGDRRAGGHFGAGVFLSETHLIVGAYLDDEGGIQDAGSLYVFEKEGSRYLQTARITDSGLTADEQFGLNVSVHGDWITTGARYSDSQGLESGAAFVYRMNREPELRSVRDVPFDQGGAVTLRWGASIYDIGRNLSCYSVWRAVDEETAALWRSGRREGTFRTALLNGTERIWEWVADCRGHRFNAYEYVVPTRYDSASGHDGKHYFMVSAHQEDPNRFYDSVVDSGCSVDNLAPAPPAALRASREGGRVDLTWEPSTEPDFSVFVIRRDGAVLGSTPLNSYSDGNVEPDRTYIYQVQAADVHGNHGGWSEPVTAGPAGVERTDTEAPSSYALSNAYPNPFNPETEIRFALPKKSRVLLRVFDAMGRETGLLADGDYPAGRYRVLWEGLDRNGNPLPSGVYFFRIDTEGFTDQKKMTLVR